MTQPRFIDLYYRWMETGRMPDDGLCNSIGWSPEDPFSLLEATLSDRIDLLKEGFDFTFWASGLPEDHPDEKRTFTPLRQTIVLFCAAMAGEI